MTVDNIKEGKRGTSALKDNTYQERGQEGRNVCASATKYWESKEGRIEQRTGVVRVQASMQR